jgi:glutaredoxin
MIRPSSTHRFDAWRTPLEEIRLSHALRLASLVLCGLALWATVSAQTVYKSVGPNGQIVYSDRAPVSGHLEKTMKFADLPSSALPASAASFMEQFRRTHPADSGAAAPTSAGAAVLYSAVWCGYCKKAKAWLAARGVAYQDVDVDTPAGMAAFAQATGGKSGIPVLMAKGQKVTGFSTAAYDAIFPATR